MYKVKKEGEYRITNGTGNLGSSFISGITKARLVIEGKYEEKPHGMGTMNVSRGLQAFGFIEFEDEVPELENAIDMVLYDDEKAILVDAGLITRYINDTKIEILAEDYTVQRND